MHATFEEITDKLIKKIDGFVDTGGESRFFVRLSPTIARLCTTYIISAYSFEGFPYTAPIEGFTRKPFLHLFVFCFGIIRNKCSSGIFEGDMRTEVALRATGCQAVKTY